jgi:type IV pilus assembly protein PilY1
MMEDSGGKVLDLLATSTSTNQDYISQLYFDSPTQSTMAHRWTDNGNGQPGTKLTPDVKFEDLGTLWEAGQVLWARDPGTEKRKIYTTINGTSFLTGNFSADTTASVGEGTSSNIDNSATLQTYLNLASCATGCDLNNDMNGDGIINQEDARALIKYIHGYDSFCSGTSQPCTTDTDCASLGVTCAKTLRSRTVQLTPTGPSNTWKLGDILNSTPRISSWMQLNAYDKVYNDTTYTDYLATSTYQNRGMVFTGANDGMLHAFYLGQLKLPSPVSSWTPPKTCSNNRAQSCSSGADCGGAPCTSTQVAKLDDDGTGLGSEVWSFIPENALPFLKYLPRQDYCHVYSVDLTPYIFDASVNIDTGASGQSTACQDPTYPNYWECKKTASSWRTILIGGMRYGGGCKQTCSDGDCVPTPATDPSSNPLGYSSYFALDITDQKHPKLMWEFSSSALGYSTTGPSVVRVDSVDSSFKKMQDTNGRWFVVFGSGPTGPINKTYQQLEGHSDQPLKLFIFDLMKGPTGADARTIDTSTLDPNLETAFGGSMINAVHDSDLDYQDDVLYIPYVRKCTAGEASLGTACSDSSTWTNGGVLRLSIPSDYSTINNVSQTALYPANWKLSELVDGTGPVTSAVVQEQNGEGQLWAFFGAGRYFYAESTNIDDPGITGLPGTYVQRKLFGMMDPCFSGSGLLTSKWTPNCTASVSRSNLADVTCSSCNGLSGSALTSCMATCAVVPTGDSGWYISLDPPGTYTYTDPDTNVTSTRYYYSEREITDPLAASSGIVFFTTYKPYNDQCFYGGKSSIWAVAYNTGGIPPGAILQGKALMQVSTGAIEQVNMSSQNFQAGAGRKSAALEGVPPTAQGLSVISAPPPVKKMLYMRER